MKNVNDEITFLKPQVVWDLESASPTLFSHLRESDRWVQDSYQELLQRVPATKSYRLFFKNGFIRLKNHVRAFYMLGPSNQVFAIKGTEPTADELEDKLRKMSKNYVAYEGSLMEAFVIRELKAPMALLESEAREEVKKAVEFQTAYLKRFGRLASVPTPLMIGRLPESAKLNYWKLISPLLSERSRSILDRILKADHLAAYVYYYPAIPTRASHFSPNLTGKDNQGYEARRKNHLAINRMFHKDFDLLSVLDRWCELIVDMFELGYFPCSLSDYNIGQCVQRQNCVMDGGFVDVGSLCLMANITEDYIFRESFFMMMTSFSNTVERMFLGDVEEKSKQHMSVSSLVHDCTLKEINAKVDERISKGIVFDERLLELLDSIKNFRGIDLLFAKIYSSEKQ